MSYVQPKILANLPLLTCLGCALIPFIAVHAAFFIAASYGLVDWCNPYIDSCTSISATGRKAPASFVFRAGMLPSAMLMMLYWWLHWRWLTTFGGVRGSRGTMLGLGWLACLGLILYVTVLGEIGDLWRLQRKIGTILFFSFTFISQLLLAAMLRKLPESVHPRATTVGTKILCVCSLMLVIGIASIVIQAISESAHDRIEDAIEWQLALLLQLNFFLSSALWRHGEWQIGFESKNPAVRIQTHAK